MLASGPHLIFAKKGQAGEIVDIRDVRSGLECDCTCYECGATLVAHKGTKIAHHFKHQSFSTCNPSPESQLHHFAKKIIEERLFLYLPEATVSISGRSETVDKSGWRDFEAAVCEKSIGDMTPDLILTTTSGSRLHVEIFVRHKCGAEKIEKFKKGGLDAIEINLSAIDWNADRTDWINSILKEAPRAWLHNCKVSEREQQIKQAAQEKRNGLTAAFAIAKTNRSPPDDTLRADYDNVVKFDCEDFIGEPFEGDTCFVVDAKYWQARLINQYFLSQRNDSKEIFDTRAALKLVGKYIAPKLTGRIDKDHADAIRLKVPDFRSPWEVVTQYHDWLRDEQGFLERQSSCKKWVISNTAVQELERAKKRQVWRVKTREWLDTILDRLPSAETVNFDRLAWIEKYAQDFDDYNLKMRMDQIGGMVISGNDIVSELLCLPLEHERERQRLKRAEEQELRSKKEQIARLQLASERRKGEIIAYASQKLGNSSSVWLKTPIETGETKTRLEMAMESADGLATVKETIDQIVKEKHEQKKQAQFAARQKKLLIENQAVLTQKAETRFRDPARSRLWLNSGQPKLQGKHPIHFCTDKDKLEQCIKLLG